MMGVLGAASPHNHHRPPARLPRFLWEAENKRNSFSISLYYFLSVSRPESSGYSLNGSSEPAAFGIIVPVVVYSLTFKPHLQANALLEANDLILSPCMCLWVPMVTWYLTYTALCRALRFHGFSYSPSLVSHQVVGRLLLLSALQQLLLDRQQTSAERDISV